VRRVDVAVAAAVAAVAAAVVVAVAAVAVAAVAAVPDAHGNQKSLAGACPVAYSDLAGLSAILLCCVRASPMFGSAMHLLTLWLQLGARGLASGVAVVNAHVHSQNHSHCDHPSGALQHAAPVCHHQASSPAIAGAVQLVSLRTKCHLHLLAIRRHHHHHVLHHAQLPCWAMSLTVCQLPKHGHFRSTLAQDLEAVPARQTVCGRAIRASVCLPVQHRVVDPWDLSVTLVPSGTYL
jgi:hypothetical protein